MSTSKLHTQTVHACFTVIRPHVPTESERLSWKTAPKAAPFRVSIGRDVNFRLPDKRGA